MAKKVRNGAESGSGLAELVKKLESLRDRERHLTEYARSNLSQEVDNTAASMKVLSGTRDARGLLLSECISALNATWQRLDDVTRNAIRVRSMQYPNEMTRDVVRANAWAFRNLVERFPVAPVRNLFTDNPHSHPVERCVWLCFAASDEGEDPEFNEDDMGVWGVFRLSILPCLVDLMNAEGNATSSELEIAEDWLQSVDELNKMSNMIGYWLIMQLLDLPTNPDSARGDRGAFIATNLGAILTLCIPALTDPKIVAVRPKTWKDFELTGEAKGNAPKDDYTTPMSWKGLVKAIFPNSSTSPEARIDELRGLMGINKTRWFQFSALKICVELKGLDQTQKGKLNKFLQEPTDKSKDKKPLA